MRCEKRVALCTALLILVIPARAQEIVSFTDIDYLPDLAYDRGQDCLDIYMPDGAALAPVVLFFHGGALRAGDKADGRIVAERLVPLGIGVVSANYRLTPDVMHPAHIEDAAAATAWVLGHIREFGGDPGSIFVSGHSAGAYLAALLALDASRLKVVGLSPDAIRGTIPISPFLYVEETAADRPKDVWGENPADWLKASVTPHIGPGKGPMLLIYADGDDAWRQRQNVRFGDEMRSVGNRNVRVVQVPNRDHGSLMSKLLDADDEIGGLILQFIRSNAASN